MRKLVYELANGVEVVSYDEAKESGQSFKAKMVEVESEPVRRSPVAQAMIDQFGYVSPSLKDKVILEAQN